MNLHCLIGFLVTNLIIPNVLLDNMAPRRTTSSQNSQANNDVPPPLEGLPPMNVEELYRYFETLTGLVEHQARTIETRALGQHSSSKGSSFDDFKKLGSPYFLILQSQWKQKVGFLR